uniref:Uncharacterized protein n=1 Tax=Opuntia streptacantha TaxID=393608 RepID=A0A7C8ZNS8_OPUST
MLHFPSISSLRWCSSDETSFRTHSLVFLRHRPIWSSPNPVFTCPILSPSSSSSSYVMLSTSSLQSRYRSRPPNLRPITKPFWNIMISSSPSGDRFRKWW